MRLRTDCRGKKSHLIETNRSVIPNTSKNSPNSQLSAIYMLCPIPQVNTPLISQYLGFFERSIKVRGTLRDPVANQSTLIRLPWLSEVRCSYNHPTYPLSGLKDLHLYSKREFPFHPQFLSVQIKRIGNGIMAIHRNASKLVAHATPSRSYIWVANSGKPAAIKARAQAVAANALLALSK